MNFKYQIFKTVIFMAVIYEVHAASAQGPLPVEERGVQPVEKHPRNARIVYDELPLHQRYQTSSLYHNSYNPRSSFVPLRSLLSQFLKMFVYNTRVGVFGLGAATALYLESKFFPKKHKSALNAGREELWQKTAQKGAEWYDRNFAPKDSDKKSAKE